MTSLRFINIHQARYVGADGDLLCVLPLRVTLMQSSGFSCYQWQTDDVPEILLRHGHLPLFPTRLGLLEYLRSGAAGSPFSEAAAALSTPGNSLWSHADFPMVLHQLRSRECLSWSPRTIVRYLHTGDVLTAMALSLEVPSVDLLMDDHQLGASLNGVLSLGVDVSPFARVNHTVVADQWASVIQEIDERVVTA